MEHIENGMDYTSTEDKLLQAATKVRCKQAKISAVTSMAVALASYNVDALAHSTLGPVVIAGGIVSGCANIYLAKKHSSKL
ncbi:hypothetical protein [Enterococcus sp. AZ109]|uniref:hypothetical protein n=1 Tax=Enterococcus sp. AZ109 TaxID=2774634 RepID=UPI003F26D950